MSERATNAVTRDDLEFLDGYIISDKQAEGTPAGSDKEYYTNPRHHRRRSR